MPSRRREALPNERIASAADFSEAYEGWFPDYQSKAEGEKSFAEYLQEHADAGSNPAYYGKYLTPKTAAEETLHLSVNAR